MGAFLEMLNAINYEFSEEILQEVSALEVMATVLEWQMNYMIRIDKMVGYVNFNKEKYFFGLSIKEGKVSLTGNVFGLTNMISNIATKDMEMEPALKDCIERIKKVL